MIPATEPIEAWRNARYAEEFFFTDEGNAPVDLTGYTGALQVRLYGAQPGAAQINLPSAAGASEGVSIIDPRGGCLRIQIERETLRSVYERLAPGLEAGQSIKLEYDLALDPPGGGRELWLQGLFLLHAGVTVQ